MVANGYDPDTANLTSTSKFGRLDQSFSYNGDGTLATRADGLNQTTTFSNYKRGLARNASYADGTGESATIDDRGLITSVTDANGFTTSYGYDLIGRLNRIVRPTGDPVAWNDTTLAFEPVPYDEYGLPAGHWRQTVATGNARTIIYFDALWRPRLTRTFDLANEGATAKTVLRSFDSDNRTVFESYPARANGSVDAGVAGTTTVHDPLGRVTISAADSELGSLISSTEYLGGFVQRSTNARGFATVTGYQSFDQPSTSAITSITAPEGVSVSIARDVFGKPTDITRGGAFAGSGPASVTRSYVYDDYQRLCKTVEPEIGATIQAYDAANNTAWRATGVGLTGTAGCDQASVPGASMTAFTYDSRNRLTGTGFGDGSPAIGRSYTADGLLRTVVSNGSTWTYGYNNRRLLTTERLDGTGWAWADARAYDANGHQNSLVYPSGSTVNYGVNALGEVTQVGGYASNVSYHPNGAVAGYTLGNGIVHTTTQNTRGLPYRNIDAGVMQDRYDYDANANVASITDEHEGVSNRAMGYDGLDRLTVANSPGVWGNAGYGYDALDNLRTSVVGGRSSTHNYNANNRLDTINTNGAYTGYVYDAQGNITGRGAQGFYFDQGNRLQVATGPNGQANYTYDGLGRRYIGSHPNGHYFVHFYSQAGQLLYGQRYEGVWRETQYVYLAGKQIAETDVSTWTTTYAHTDGLGSPVAKSNSAGALISRTRYEPYGNTAAGTVPTGIGFTGHVNDPDTGLVYMQQRYYDPIAARFLSTDPVVNDANTGGSFGRYHYANNNPYRYTDPDGRDPWYKEQPPPPPPRTAPENLSFCQSATGTNCGWGNTTLVAPPASSAGAPAVTTSDPTVLYGVLAGIDALSQPTPGCAAIGCLTGTLPVGGVGKGLATAVAATTLKTAHYASRLEAAGLNLRTAVDPMRTPGKSALARVPCRLANSPDG